MPSVRYFFEDFELDCASRTLIGPDGQIALAAKSLDCLAYLVAHRDRAVGRDELVAAVWGRVDAGDSVISQTLLRARKALGDTGEQQRFIRTVRGFGYQWIAPVTATSAADGDRDLAHVAQPDETVKASADLDCRANQTKASEARPDRRKILAFLAIITLAAIALAVRAPWPPTSAPSSRHVDQSTILVLPVQVDGDEAQLAWLSLGGMDYLASQLRQSEVPIISNDISIKLAAQRLTASEVLQRSGASMVLTTRVMRIGGLWKARIESFDGDSMQFAEASSPAALGALSEALKEASFLLGIRLKNQSRPGSTEEIVHHIESELLSGKVRDAQQLFDSLEPSVRAEAEMKLLHGRLLYRSGNLARAARIYLDLAASEESSDAIVARAMMGFGAVSVRKGDASEALDSYTKAIQILKSLPPTPENLVLVGNAQGGRAMASMAQGRASEAINDLGLAKVAMEQSGNLVDAAVIKTNLGSIYFQQGHGARAVIEYEDAIETFERFGIVDYLAAALVEKSLVLMSALKYDDAASALSKANSYVTAIEDPQLRESIFFASTRLALVTGDLDGASGPLDELSKNAKLSQAIDASVLELEVRHLAQQGKFDEASIIAERSRDKTAVTGTLALAAVQVELMRGDDQAAGGWINLMPKPNWHSAELGVFELHDAVAWLMAAAIYRESIGDSDSAIEHVREATRLAAQAKSAEVLVSAESLAVFLLTRVGRLEEARAQASGLQTYVNFDYNTAWVTADLLRAINDPHVQQSIRSLQLLKGERDTALPPYW